MMAGRWRFPGCYERGNFRDQRTLVSLAPGLCRAPNTEKLIIHSKTVQLVKYHEPALYQSLPYVWVQLFQWKEVVLKFRLRAVAALLAYRVVPYDTADLQVEAAARRKWIRRVLHKIGSVLQYCTSLEISQYKPWYNALSLEKQTALTRGV
jgi:hypothetical protein